MTPKLKKRLWLIVKLFVVGFLVLNFAIAFRAYKYSHVVNLKPGMEVPGQEGTAFRRFNAFIFGIYLFKETYDTLPPQGYTNLTISSTDNIQLACWQRKVDSAIGTVLLFHGFGGNKTTLLREAEFFAQKKYNVFLMDFRAHGNSNGEQTLIGKLEYNDVAAVYDYVKQNIGPKIICYGFSMGAASILHAVHQKKINPNAVVLDAPYANYEKLIAKMRFNRFKVVKKPVAKLFTLWMGLLNNTNMFTMNPAEFAKSVTCPVLLQYATHDELITEDDSKHIFDNINTRNKILKAYPLFHESVFNKEQNAWEQAVSQLLEQVK
jgi:uncharacterized protein